VSDVDPLAITVIVLCLVPYVALGWVILRQRRKS
jgi:hypothetical protein